MNTRKKTTINIWVALLFLFICLIPTKAADLETQATGTIQPRFENIYSARVGLAFDTNNVAYCSIVIGNNSCTSGISGWLRLYDSSETCVAQWYISDYEDPIAAEKTHQCEYGETYTCTFVGYAYGKCHKPGDRLDLSVTATCGD